MRNSDNLLSRRAWMQAAVAAAGLGRAIGASKPVPLFDGKTLDGWLQIENAATTLGSGGITDPVAFRAKLSSSSDPVSAYLRGRLSDANATTAAVLKELNAILAGPSIYDRARFEGVTLRPETQQLLRKNPSGQELARLNKLLLEDAYPAELAKSASTGWVVKDGAMASTGVGRGVIYTAKDYARFRLMFTMRHVSGNPDHHACILIFCTRPQSDEKPLDALGGIQFQAPLGGHWDYRPGKNNAGDPHFTRLVRPAFDPHEWSRVEIVADAAIGTASMTVAQPVGSKAIEVLQFKDASAGRSGPIAWQMHNAGLFDEYKDVTIEVT
jgi:hypothetical protein